jgi:ketosteroid isomerase-like protein
MTTMPDPAVVSTTRALVDRFNQAWNDHDLDTALSMISPDCVFESTSPAPDGIRYVGPEQIRDAWAPIFADASSRFTVENAIVTEDHVVQRWRYDWTDGYVRGIDVIEVRDGRVAAKLAYVKG